MMFIYKMRHNLLDKVYLTLEKPDVSKILQLTTQFVFLNKQSYTR